MCDEEYEGNGYTGTIRGTAVVCHCGCEGTMKGAETQDDEELSLRQTLGLNLLLLVALISVEAKIDETALPIFSRHTLAASQRRETQQQAPRLPVEVRLTCWNRVGFFRFFSLILVIISPVKYTI